MDHPLCWNTGKIRTHLPSMFSVQTPYWISVMIPPHTQSFCTLASKQGFLQWLRMCKTLVLSVFSLLFLKNRFPASKTPVPVWEETLQVSHHGPPAQCHFPRGCSLPPSMLSRPLLSERVIPFIQNLSDNLVPTCCFRVSIIPSKSKNDWGKY